MKTWMTLWMVAGLTAGQSPAPAESVGSAVSVEIRTDDGRSLPLYPTGSGAGCSRVYAEAVKGDPYRIVVHNRLNRRVGLVIAVDGRNIISGEKSWLKNAERMYILDPYESSEYSGWRTAQDKIHRFYFTTTNDSYAGAFKDESAMGLIAMAVYPEIQRCAELQLSGKGKCGSGNAGMPCPSAKRECKKAVESADQAGTGYGHEEYSPSFTVSFEPESTPREKTLIKYEWRETLCRLGVIPTEKFFARPNRLWDSGFVPPPPGKN